MLWASRRGIEHAAADNIWAFFGNSGGESRLRGSYGPHQMTEAHPTAGEPAPDAAHATPPAKRALPAHRPAGDPAMPAPRTFLTNRFVYTLISQRGRGLSIGVNMNPDILCSFDCVYCEVNRNRPVTDRRVDLKVMMHELERLLTLALQGKIRELPPYRQTPEDLLQLKEVALSGDGEPTLSPQFTEIVREIIHLRARGVFPFFKIVLVTNSTGLDLPEVQPGLQMLTADDEIWAKLDAGTQAYLRKVNQGEVELTKILHNILMLAKRRPVIIQSLFPLFPGGEEPPAEEIDQYAQRLRELREKGANIPLVQIYSAHRPAVRSACGHLPLRSLSRIAQRVRDIAGLKAEVF